MARNTLMRFLITAGCLNRRDALTGWLLLDAEPPAPLLVTNCAVAASLDFRFIRSFSGGETTPKAGTVIAMDVGGEVSTHRMTTVFWSCPRFGYCAPA